VSAAISLESVSKRYGSKTIVHDLTFTVQPGEIVGFLGPNGAGKTTTMRMISGYTTPSSGKLRVAGFDMVKDNDQAARKLGYLPETPPLYDTLEVAQYLRFVARVKSVPRGEIKSEIDRVTRACRLEDVHKKEVYKLSKGYRQRLGLAQALIGKPEVLLLDEPTAGLDPGQIQETREVIRSFGEKHAVLLSTHILPEVTMICARVAIINHGRLIAIDSPQALQRAAEQPNVSLVTDAPAAEVSAELRAIDGVSDVVTRAAGNDGKLLAVDCRVDSRAGVEANIARAVTRRWNLYRLERQQPTLESIFLRYVQSKAS
jgi:ABC-2 type transport system ATP-binding protein